MRKILSGRRCLSDTPFKFTIDTNNTSATSSSSTQFILPIPDATPSGAGNMSMIIDWGDNSALTNLTASNFSTARSHTYSSAGTYNIQVSGDVRNFSFGAMGTGFDDASKVTEITQWGDLKVTENRAFTGCLNCGAISCEDIPNFERSAVGFNMFQGMSSLKRINNIANWDVSNLSTMYSMFRNCGNLSDGTNAGGPINLTGWDVSNITSMFNAFGNCSSFNGRMFVLTSNTSIIENMFSGCTVFNNAGVTSIEAWDVTGVSDFSQVFNDCRAFNRDISSWDMSGATNLERMFAINNVTGVFNQPIGSWDTSSVQNFNNILGNQTSFNQDISNWDLTAVNTIGTGAYIPISTSTSSSFQFPIVLSTANYDAALIAWDADTYPSMPSGTWGFGLSQYSAAPSAAATARASLVTKWGGITDGGPV